MQIEKKIESLGIKLPDLGVWDSNIGTAQKYYGQQYGKMKPFHRSGGLLILSGHVPDLPDGTVLHPGRVGAEVTVEQGYAAARQTGINCLAGIKQAIGDLDKITNLVRTLNFVVCAPGFTDPNLISSGLTDLFAEVFGPEKGIGCRATIGVMSLANNHCYETWMDLEVRS
ncbi:RidA family protein [Taklimakanibacter albus]|uniref:RidA family protein n=1 Tax=Taklimakanibacter albus TaxID=2800327 RepID=A0ACC5RFM3_9HYPH|nr:RidA family protein [Aestuariivirga sp. YIM B02566]MBK1871311.1 RidA family protein [Aestuariivirga sp. YIM B02566]